MAFMIVTSLCLHAIRETFLALSAACRRPYKAYMRVPLSRLKGTTMPRLGCRADGNIEGGLGYINTNNTGLRGHRNLLDAHPPLWIRALGP